MRAGDVWWLGKTDCGTTKAISAWLNFDGVTFPLRHSAFLRMRCR